MAMGDLTGDLLAAVVAATPERKELALKFLRGELTEVPRPATGPVLMGMGAAAAFLGVSRPTLWRVLQMGKIQKVELFPGSYRVRREDLEALADGKFGMSGHQSKRGRPRKVATGGREDGEAR
jgi:excisionase family DNA binding protein